jgi:hypothetical protein
MLGESYTEELRKIPAVRRRLSDISEDLCDQLIDHLKTSRFALQVHEITDVVKDAYLITYVWYVENDTRRIFLFCKLAEGRATSLEVFNIINHVLEGNETNWKTSDTD